ncbi:MAG: ATPase P [Legionella sp.]|nr:MAG: ATPase P [Legionella sp.]
MLTIDIPGFKNLTLHHVMLDYNGTMAVDGILIKNIMDHLNALSEHLFLHVVTGDGYGTAKEELVGVNCLLKILPKENQAYEKQAYLHQLNPNETVVIGNGRNDYYALKDAALGIVVMGDEGIATEAIEAADLVLPSIERALEILNNPRRLIGTLRV